MFPLASNSSFINYFFSPPLNPSLFVSFISKVRVKNNRVLVFRTCWKTNAIFHCDCVTSVKSDLIMKGGEEVFAIGRSLLLLQKKKRIPSFFFYQLKCSNLFRLMLGMYLRGNYMLWQVFEQNKLIWRKHKNKPETLFRNKIRSVPLFFTFCIFPLPWLFSVAVVIPSCEFFYHYVNR